MTHHLKLGLKLGLKLAAGCSILVAASAVLSAQAPTAARPPSPRVRMAPGPADRLPPDRTAAERGKKEFVSACGFCHGSSATGGSGGPDLIRSLLVMHDAGGDKIGPVILNGVTDRGMPKFNMTQAQIADISEFLYLRREEVIARRNYEIQNVVTGDPKAGAAYFNGAGRCHTCHSPAGDLAGIATRYDPVSLQGRFLYPRQRSFPGRPAAGPQSKPVEVTVTPPNAPAVPGVLLDLDDFSVSMRDPEGRFRSWRRDRTPGLKVQVRDPLAAHVELLDKYTDADMHNILAYLVTLK